MKKDPSLIPEKENELVLTSIRFQTGSDLTITLVD
jgi:hypothetical protein